MQKSLICGLVLLAVVGLCSCHNENAPQSAKRVTFEVLGLSVSTESMAPCRAVAEDVTPEEAGATDIWVLEGTTLLCHQTSADEDFGYPSVELDYGQHALTFIASGQTGQSVSQGVYTVDNVKDCYGANLALTVSATTEVQPVVMNRVCYCIKWQSLDNMPNTVSTVRLTISNYRGSLTAGLQGTNERTYTREWNATSRRGSTISVYDYGFCDVVGSGYDLQTKVEYMDASGNVLYQHTKTAEVKANRTTVISGYLFGGRGEAALNVNTTWEDDYAVSL